jgi:UDP-N-acetylmuramyl pentapeptide synthase
LIDDCYNANPMSMRAAIDDLSETAERAGGGRRVAVLGDMLELGQGERDFHVEIGEHARAAGVDVLVTVHGLAPATYCDRYSTGEEAVAYGLVDRVLEQRELPRRGRGFGNGR